MPDSILILGIPSLLESEGCGHRLPLAVLRPALLHRKIWVPALEDPPGVYENGIPVCVCGAAWPCLQDGAILHPADWIEADKGWHNPNWRRALPLCWRGGVLRSAVHALVDVAEAADIRKGVWIELRGGKVFAAVSEFWDLRRRVTTPAEVLALVHEAVAVLRATNPEAALVEVSHVA